VVTLPPFQALLDEHAADLHRYLVAVAGPHDGADCFQETVVSALRAYPGLRRDDNLRGWLFTIAHRRSVDELRSKTKRREQSQPLTANDAPSEGVPHDPATVGADSAFEDLTSLDRAIELVRRLPPDMAEAVMLRIVNDLSYADVAKILGTSEGSVRVLVHRGLRSLRSKIVVTNSDGSPMYLVL